VGFFAPSIGRRKFFNFDHTDPDILPLRFYEISADGVMQAAHPPGG
jgi:hypothetical protein